MVRLNNLFVNRLRRMFVKYAYTFFIDNLMAKLCKLLLIIIQPSDYPSEVGRKLWKNECFFITFIKFHTNFCLACYLL